MDNNSLQDGSGNEFPDVEYAGFWIRFLASVLDSILILLIIVPLLLIIYGPGVFFVSESPGLAYDLINYVLPIVAIVVFWQYRSATPGKIMMGIYIVDAKTFQHPLFGRLVLRYLGYYVSLLPLFLGFIWVAFDKRKQGFHDMIARTVVIKMPEGGLETLAALSADDQNSVDDETMLSDDEAGNPGTGKEESVTKIDPWKE